MERPYSLVIVGRNLLKTGTNSPVISILSPTVAEKLRLVLTIDAYKSHLASHAWADRVREGSASRLGSVGCGTLQDCRGTQAADSRLWIRLRVPGASNQRLTRMWARAGVPIVPNAAVIRSCLACHLGPGPRM